MKWHVLSQTGILKGLKNGKFRRGLVILESRGHGGMRILEFPRARGGGGGGLKILMPPMVGYGYFLESPNGSTGQMSVSSELI